MHSRLAHFLALLLSQVASARSASTPEPWSAFGAGDVAAVSAGAVQFKPSTSMNFPRGLSAQALYVVEAEVETAVQTLTTLDPTLHAELGVFQQRVFRAESDARFSELRLDRKAPPFDRLLSEMTTAKALQLSTEERARLPRQKSASAAQEFWAQLLRERWSRLVRDGQVAPVGGFEARSEIRSLLHDEPKLATHFAPILQPWTTAGGNPAATAARFYWDVSQTEGIANLELGAVAERTEGDRRQVADVTYYASSGYLAAISLFEFAPLAGGPAARTLVWHGTLVSSAEVEGAFGLKRKFAMRTVEDEMRRWIAIFRRACTEKKK